VRRLLPPLVLLFFVSALGQGHAQATVSGTDPPSDLARITTVDFEGLAVEGNVVLLPDGFSVTASEPVHHSRRVDIRKYNFTPKVIDDLKGDPCD